MPVMSKHEELSESSLRMLDELKLKEPWTGDGDFSPCLPSWINSLAKCQEAGTEFRISHNAVGALLHTMFANYVRVARLARERDELRAGE